MKPKIISKVSLVAFLLLSLAASLANAQSEPVYSRGDWVVGLNATRVLTDEDLRSASAGVPPFQIPTCLLTTIRPYHSTCRIF